MSIFLFVVLVVFFAWFVACVCCPMFVRGCVVFRAVHFLVVFGIVFVIHFAHCDIVSCVFCVVTPSSLFSDVFLGVFS